MATTAVPAGLLNTYQTITGQGKAYDKEDSDSDQYYAFLAELEDVQYTDGGPITYSAQFEIVPVEWMEAAVLNMPSDTRKMPPVAPYSLFFFDDAPLDELAGALDTPVQDLAEGEWFIFTLGKGTKTGKRVTPSRGMGPVSMKAKGVRVPLKTANVLKNRYRPVSRFSLSYLYNLLFPIQPREIGVMDVGQASCNLVYNGAGVPQLYVDAGLPMPANFLSLPPPNATGQAAVVNPGPCLANNPPGIITHFHWDHYFMLNFAQNSAQLRSRDWILPGQPQAAMAVMAMVAGIAANAGQVHIFPAVLPALVAGAVQIVQCVPGAGVPPGDVNNTGLAVLVRLDDAQGLEALLPGDAAFQSIPGVGAIAGLRWMVASHHGSDRNLAPPPPPLIAPPVPAPDVPNQGRLAYSYGIMPGGVHCYGHPRAPAVLAYPAAGWGQPGNVASTAETGPNSGVAGRGNSMLGNNVIPPFCGVFGCPFHAFPAAKILV